MHQPVTTGPIAIVSTYTSFRNCSVVRIEHQKCKTIHDPTLRTLESTYDILGDIGTTHPHIDSFFVYFYNRYMDIVHFRCATVRVLIMRYVNALSFYNNNA